MTCGVITAIQRMSIHDGGGIRSTLFLKGCNMRCRWCHNPETWSREKQLQLVAAKCIRCGSCLDTCNTQALTLDPEGIRVERTACTACGSCAEACPSGALSLIGELISPDEAFRRIRKDIPFFNQTGGGVTVSGGEPLLQPRFLMEFLGLCRESGIHTAIETNLSADWELIEELLPAVDLWMCDLKTADPALHKKMTGLDNSRIIANLESLIRSGAAVIVRTPVVPGVNDSPEAIGAICKLLKPFEDSIRRYELLRFHTLGFDKFASCGVENPLAGAQELSPERFDTLRNHAQSILEITR